MAADPLYVGDGAHCVADQRVHQRRLERSRAVCPGGGGWVDARNAADDRQFQPGEGRYRHVATQSGGQAFERHSELWRDGRVVHRQNRHPDAGSHHP
ncbi:hypothetical protein D3C87_1828050 [compost metagenome]